MYNTTPSSPKSKIPFNYCLYPTCECTEHCQKRITPEWEYSELRTLTTKTFFGGFLCGFVSALSIAFLIWLFFL